MLVGNGVLASAAEKGSAGNAENSLLQETVASLEKGYSEYYGIPNTETTFCCSHETEGEVENTYLLEMTVVLKAESVEEMPYYQGAAAYCETMEASVGRQRTEADLLRMEMVSTERSDLYAELEEYIGEEQEMAFYIKEIYPAGCESEKKILFENEMDYVTWEEMLPPGRDEICGNGYTYMKEMDAEYCEAVADGTLQQAKAASYDYVVSEAVSYMRRYTSNPTSCNMCGGSCGQKVDTTKYNPAYTHYAADHSDCANYLSQAMCEGGIPTDSTWEPGSGAWINVEKLGAYMTSNGYWTNASWNTAQRGDILYRCDSERHVMMITSYDGVTYKVSAHTNDRKDYVMSKSVIDKYTRYRI